MIDTLGEADRFAVLAFDNTVETPPAWRPGLFPRPTGTVSALWNTWRRSSARGGTEMAEPLVQAMDRLTENRLREMPRSGLRRRIARPHPRARDRWPGRQ